METMSTNRQSIQYVPVLINICTIEKPSKLSNNNLRIIYIRTNKVIPFISSI